MAIDKATRDRLRDRGLLSDPDSRDLSSLIEALEAAEARAETAERDVATWRDIAGAYELAEGERDAAIARATAAEGLATALNAAASRVEMLGHAVKDRREVHHDVLAIANAARRALVAHAGNAPPSDRAALVAVAQAASAYAIAYDTPGMAAPEVLEDRYLDALRRALASAGYAAYEGKTVGVAEHAAHPPEGAPGVDDAPPVTVRYRNHRGIVAWRRITPRAVRYGTTAWHPEPQWLLDGYDHDKGAERTYALAGIGAIPSAVAIRRLALLRNLVRTLPKCDDCDAPATRAWHRNAGRWCDAHVREIGAAKERAPDYPRAPALRAAIAEIEAADER